LHHENFLFLISVRIVRTVADKTTYIRICRLQVRDPEFKPAYSSIEWRYGAKYVTDFGPCSVCTNNKIGAALHAMIEMEAAIRVDLSKMAIPADRIAGQRLPQDVL